MLLRVKQFQVKTPEAIWLGLNEYQRSQCGLTDCIIGAIAHHHGYPTVMTFDKQATKSELFSLIS